MNNIEKIRTYIRCTGVKYSESTPYQMKTSDLFALIHMAENDTSGAICLAFEYGRAKGERSAKTVQKRRTIREN